MIPHATLQNVHYVTLPRLLFMPRRRTVCVPHTRRAPHLCRFRCWLNSNTTNNCHSPAAGDGLGSLRTVCHLAGAVCRFSACRVCCAVPVLRATLNALTLPGNDAGAAGLHRDARFGSHSPPLDIYINIRLSYYSLDVNIGYSCIADLFSDVYRQLPVTVVVCERGFKQRR